jgi:hypothetical protein
MSRPSSRAYSFRHRAVEIDASVLLVRYGDGCAKEAKTYCASTRNGCPRGGLLLRHRHWTFVILLQGKDDPRSQIAQPNAAMRRARQRGGSKPVLGGTFLSPFSFGGCPVLLRLPGGRNVFTHFSSYLALYPGNEICEPIG